MAMMLGLGVGKKSSHSQPGQGPRWTQVQDLGSWGGGGGGGNRSTS